MKVANNTAKNGIDAFHYLGVAYYTYTTTNGYIPGGYLGQAFYDIFIANINPNPK